MSLLLKVVNHSLEAAAGEELDQSEPAAAAGEAFVAIGAIVRVLGRKFEKCVAACERGLEYLQPAILTFPSADTWRRRNPSSSQGYARSASAAAAGS